MRANRLRLAKAEDAMRTGHAGPRFAVSGPLMRTPEPRSPRPLGHRVALGGFLTTFRHNCGTSTMGRAVSGARGMTISRNSGVSSDNIKVNGTGRKAGGVWQS